MCYKCKGAGWPRVEVGQLGVDKGGDGFEQRHPEVSVKKDTWLHVGERQGDLFWAKSMHQKSAWKDSKEQKTDKKSFKSCEFDKVT